MSITVEQAQLLVEQASTVLSSEGGVLGTVGQVYLDDLTRQPRWVSVETAGGPRFVPMTQCELGGSQLAVGFPGRVVLEAPLVVDSVQMTRVEEKMLLRYYADARSTQDHDVPDESQLESGVMLRSEERFDVAVEVHATHRVRLRKQVVTEYVTYTVPLRREELRFERELIAESPSQPSLRHHVLAEDVFDIVLHEERVSITTDIVPVERIRVRKHLVAESATIRTDLRKERVEFTGIPTGSGPDEAHTP